MIGNKTKYTPSEAIKAIDGMHRKKFYQMLQAGQISYEPAQRGTKTTKLFDASELARVFGSDFRSYETSETETTVSSKRIETTDKTLKQELLAQEIQHLSARLQDREQQLTAKEDLLNEIRRDRDDWKEQAQRLLLAHGDKAPKFAQEAHNDDLAPVHHENANRPFLGHVWAIIAVVSMMIAVGALLYVGVRQ